jgi:Ulp1 family protease
VQADLTLFDGQTITFITPPPPPSRARVLYLDGGTNTILNQQDLLRLASPTACLNDVCLNGGAAILQAQFSKPASGYSESSRRCALLSTFDLLHVRYRATDDELWRHVQRTSYWAKDVWILPIHRTAPAHHWVLAVAHLTSHQLFLFDSFASKRPWKQDVKVRGHF